MAYNPYIFAREKGLASTSRTTGGLTNTEKTNFNLQTNPALRAMNRDLLQSLQKNTTVQSTPQSTTYSGGSSGSSGGSSSAADYSSVASIYQNLLDQQRARAEELAAQKQAAAQAAYDKNMGYLKSAYESRRNLLKGNYDDSLAQLQSAYDYGAAGVNQNADKAQQQAYLNYMISKRDLPQQLTALGLTGGASESRLAGLYNNYGNSRNATDTQRASSLADLLNTYQKNKSSALQAYNTQLSNDDAQKLAYQMELEQSLANGTTDIMSDKYDSLNSIDTTYAQQMAALQEAQAKAAASAAKKSYSASNGGTSSSLTQSKATTYKNTAANKYSAAYSEALNNGYSQAEAQTTAANAAKNYYYALYSQGLISADDYSSLTS